MERRVMGVTGPEVSVVGLGCNNFGSRLDVAATRAVVSAALDAGIDHFDTAEMYGAGMSESFLGEALRGVRDRAVIATKFLPRPADQPYAPGVLRSRILASCDASLERLGTDRIDLFYQHRPDPDAPIEEVLGALAELVSAGKVLHVACSNFDAAQVAEALDCASSLAVPSFVANQVEWSLLRRDVEAEIAPASIAAGMSVVPFFPLASGLLTGKYERGVAFAKGTRLGELGWAASIATPEAFDRVELLTTFAADNGHTLLELAMSWLAAQRGVVSVIAGATSPAQVVSNVAAAGWRLSASELDQVAVITKAPLATGS